MKQIIAQSLKQKMRRSAATSKLVASRAPGPAAWWESAGPGPQRNVDDKYLHRRSCVRLQVLSRARAVSQLGGALPSSVCCPWRQQRCPTDVPDDDPSRRLPSIGQHHQVQLLALRMSNCVRAVGCTKHQALKRLRIQKVCSQHTSDWPRPPHELRSCALGGATCARKRLLPACAPTSGWQHNLTRLGSTHG